MKHAVMERWVNALRSGEYTQGKDRLKTIDNTFCCLGVLCDLYSKETGDAWDFSNRDGPIYYGCITSLPEEVRVWAGMRTGNGLLESDKPSLVILNDKGWTFSDIANIIEDEYTLL